MDSIPIPLHNAAAFHNRRRRDDIAGAGAIGPVLIQRGTVRRHRRQGLELAVRHILQHERTHGTFAVAGGVNVVGPLERGEGEDGGVGPVDGAQDDGREIVVADAAVEDLGLVGGGIGGGRVGVGVVVVVVVVVFVGGGVVVVFVVVVARTAADLGVTLSLAPFAAAVCGNLNI